MYVFLTKNAFVKKSWPGVHKSLERYSGAYVGLLYNVRCVSYANIVLASNTRTTPVQADRDFSHWEASMGCLDVANEPNIKHIEQVVCSPDTGEPAITNHHTGNLLSLRYI